MGFVVIKKNSKRRPFVIIQEFWTPERHTKTVPIEAWINFGFHAGMSLEDARARAKQLNLQNQIEQRKIVETARKVEEQKQTESAYLPKFLVEAFEEELQETYYDNPSRHKTVLKLWWAVKKLVIDLAMDPKDFYDQRIKVYNYYKNKKWSPYYIRTVNRFLNQWGYFCAKKTGSFFQPVPKMSNIQVQKVVELREEKTDIRQAADPLLWNELKNLKTKFEDEGLITHWNWMFVGLWFGLRPTEIDNLKNKKHWKVENDSKSKLKVLWVYQTKLTSIAPDKRWKPIPIYFPEQKEAFQLIEDGVLKNLRRPLNKTLKRLFGGNIQPYSPRKGFTDLMLEKGFSLEDVSTFLGHNSIETTWKHYKNKQTFKLPS